MISEIFYSIKLMNLVEFFSLRPSSGKGTLTNSANFSIFVYSVFFQVSTLVVSSSTLSNFQVSSSIALIFLVISTILSDFQLHLSYNSSLIQLIVLYFSMNSSIVSTPVSLFNLLKMNLKCSTSSSVFYKLFVVLLVIYVLIFLGLVAILLAGFTTSYF